MCLSNVYENSVEQKNLILSNVQRIDCKDGFVVLYGSDNQCARNPS